MDELSDNAHPFDALADAVRAYTDAAGGDVDAGRHLLLNDLDSALVLERDSRKGDTDA